MFFHIIHGLQQHISVPTHYQGHTLSSDTLISRDDSTLLSEIEVIDIGYAMMKVLSFEITTQYPATYS